MSSGVVGEVTLVSVRSMNSWVCTGCGDASLGVSSSTGNDL